MSPTPVLAVLAAAALASLAPQDSTVACPAVEARQLDFWIGEWDLTGRRRTTDGWVETRATNRITAVLEGCVIEERFRSAEAGGLQGMSVSVYDAQAGAWRQTWVDNQGGYLVFRGGMEEGRMILATAPWIRPAGDTLVSRMVFHDIAADSLVWDWERSTDAGRSWTLQWTLTYRRRP